MQAQKYARAAKPLPVICTPFIALVLTLKGVMSWWQFHLLLGKKTTSRSCTCCRRVSALQLCHTPYLLPCTDPKFLHHKFCTSLARKSCLALSYRWRRTWSWRCQSSASRWHQGQTCAGSLTFLAKPYWFAPFAQHMLCLIHWRAVHGTNTKCNVIREAFTLKLDPPVSSGCSVVDVPGRSSRSGTTGSANGALAVYVLCFLL